MAVTQPPLFFHMLYFFSLCFFLLKFNVQRREEMQGQVLRGVVNPASTCQLASGHILVYFTFELNTDVGSGAYILQS